MSRQMLVTEIVKIERDVPDLPAKVRAARKRSGKSIQALAVEIDVSRQYLSYLENDRLESVDSHLIRKIEIALGERLI